MAGKIKGIDIEIGGDTTGLDKALKMSISQQRLPAMKSKRLTEP